MKNKLFQQEKEFWKSKTFWVNVLIVLGGSATMIAGELETGGTLTTIGVINIILRVMTKAGIKF
jgi:hypothetical protein